MTVKSNIKIKNEIRINRKFFNKCLWVAKLLIKNKQYENASNYLQKLATFGWSNTTGYYVSWKLESLLHVLSKQIDYKCNTKKRKKDENGFKILHIATELYEIGGHTQLLFQWITNDKENFNEIVVTRQSIDDLPKNKIKKFGIDLSIFTSLVNSSILSKALELRKMAENYDFVVFHIHPDDIIPVLAFSTYHLPPVLFMNHADHIFWVGASILDVLLQITEEHIDLDKIRRNIIQKQCYLPIPITIKENTLDHLRIKKKLGIISDQFIMLTIAEEYKIRPNYAYNFFNAIYPVLDKYSHITLYIVGCRPDSDLAKKYNHKQINYLGRIEFTLLHEYEIISDIIVESMPLGSYTADLECMALGKVVHFGYASFISIYPIICTDSIKNWQLQLEKLINDHAYRQELGRDQFEYVKSNYGIDTWRIRLKNIYGDNSALTHNIILESPDNFWEGRDEINLRTLDFNLEIDYFSYTYELSFLNRLSIFAYFFLNKIPKNITKTTKKENISYVFPKAYRLRKFFTKTIVNINK